MRKNIESLGPGERGVEMGMGKVKRRYCTTIEKKLASPSGAIKNYFITF